MTPPDPRVEVEHCPGCEDPSRYASRGCPGIESASDDTAKKNANGDILTELAALLFAARPAHDGRGGIDGSGNLLVEGRQEWRTERLLALDRQQIQQGVWPCVS